MAVCHRVRDDLSGDITAGAAAVVHHHRLPQTLGEFLRHRTCRTISTTAGRKANHDIH